MSLLLIGLLAAGLFVLIAVGVGRSDQAVVQELEQSGRLCLGTVLGFDSDGNAEVEFHPPGAAAPLRTIGLSFFDEKRFPAGSRVAVLYKPMCPAVNRVMPDRTDEAAGSA